MTTLIAIYLIFYARAFYFNMRLCCLFDELTGNLSVFISLVVSIIVSLLWPFYINRIFSNIEVSLKDFELMLLNIDKADDS